ncbi:hypothetical protein [Melioribacter sp. OK-1-Me]
MGTNQNINNHQVFMVIDQIRSRLGSDDASQIPIEDRDLIISIIEYFEARMSIVYVEFTIKNTLNTIQTYFQQALNDINNFLVNKNYGHINNAKNSLINAIPSINSLPFIIPKRDNLSKIVTDFRNLVTSELKEMQNKFNDIKNKISSFNQLVTQIDQRFSQQQQQINQLSAGFQNEFNQLKSSLSKEIVEEKNKVIEQSNRLLNELSNKLESAKKIVNIIGNISVTGDYQETAEYHRKQANVWRRITVVFMTVAVGYMAFTVLNIGHYDWHISLLRILSTLLFIYPAQYAANQSKIHRDQEIYNKKMELDLAAINPFIELFDEKKKQEIKEKLVEKYFSPNTINDKVENGIPITVYEKIISQIISLIKSFKGTGA